MKKLLTVITAVLMLTACASDKASKCSASSTSNEKIDVSICTFNIMIKGHKPRGVKPPIDVSWDKRLPILTSFIKQHNFDIVACQEPIPMQVDSLKEKLVDYDLYYKPVRTTMNPSPCNPIYFKKSRFELLDKGEFYYSKTPEVESNDWDSPRSRCCTWVKLREKKSGKEFYIFNTHFTHIGKVAKFESAKILVKKITEIAKGAPSFAMGDLNSVPNSRGIQHISSCGFMKDSKTASLSDPVGDGPSYHGYKSDNPKANRIDFIFVSSDVEVQSYCLDKKKYGDIHTSDHYPVYIKTRF
ncbi:MAG: endonuclease/exonuclease/phosphatase family protein [Opitutales bacterium]|nr:endonuclease/exonuclease/phosphatase family protein [Opitutales bacterium]